MAHLVELLASWELALRAERQSPSTVKTFGDGVQRFLSKIGHGEADLMAEA